MRDKQAGHRLKVWFDADCPLCRREIRLLQRLDKQNRIHFIDLRAAAEDCPVDRGEMLKRLHAQYPEGRTVSGAEAFAAMWRRIPLLRPLGLAARWRPALSVLEWLYIRFLKIRPGLQKLAIRLGG